MRCSTSSGEAGCRRVDLYLNIRDVGNGVDRQSGEIPRAKRGDAERDQQHEQTLPNSKCENCLHHNRLIFVMPQSLLFSQPFCQFGLDHEAVFGRIHIAIP
jgi:hypothetical protein